MAEGRNHQRNLRAQHSGVLRLHQVGEKISLALAPTINLDNTPTDGTYNAVRLQAQKTFRIMESDHGMLYNV